MEPKTNDNKVETIIGDGAYSEKENLDYCNENKIKNVSKLSKMVTHGNSKRNDDFEYNKDAGMYVCKTGHMVIKKHFKKEMNTIIIQKLIIISLTWKNVNIVRLKMVAIKMVQKQNHIMLL